VCDRFVDSTRAYQGIGLGMGHEVVDAIYRRIAPNFEPDLTLLLDLPVETGLARMTARGGQDDRYQQKNIDFHRKLRDAYMSLAKQYAHRFHVIDASVDADSVAATIETATCGHFGL
jgi:dTMP kinase